MSDSNFAPASGARMLRNALLGALAAALVPAAAGADVITTWHDVATNASAVAPPAERPAAGLDWALVHGAMYDAVNAIQPRRSVLFASPTTAAAGASVDAAAASAAYTVLSALFPSQQSTLFAAYGASLAAIPDGDAKTRGVQVGTEVGQGVLATRAGDGRYAVVPYVFGSGPGVYQATPPAFGSPVLPWLAQVRPFVLTSFEQVRGDGPPALTSATYAADYAETKAYGALFGSLRDDAQTEIGRFHTENPTRFWGRNIGALAAGMNLDVPDHARLMASLFVSYGDANIACWNAKYEFNRWRPVTAIPAGDTDGNAATVADAAWTPLAVTPPHPEYPAAHGCAAGALMEALRDFRGTKRIAMSFTSTVTGATHTFARTDDLLEEIVNARIYGGMHFRTSVEDGEALGKRVAKWVVRRKFQPLGEECDSRHEDGRRDDESRHD